MRRKGAISGNLPLLFIAVLSVGLGMQAYISAQTMADEVSQGVSDLGHISKTKTTNDVFYHQYLKNSASFSVHQSSFEIAEQGANIEWTGENVENFDPDDFKILLAYFSNAYFENEYMDSAFEGVACDYDEIDFKLFAPSMSEGLESYSITEEVVNDLSKMGTECNFGDSRVNYETLQGYFTTQYNASSNRFYQIANSTLTFYKTLNEESEDFSNQYTGSSGTSCGSRPSSYETQAEREAVSKFEQDFNNAMDDAREAAEEELEPGTGYDTEFEGIRTYENTLTAGNTINSWDGNSNIRWEDVGDCGCGSNFNPREDEFFNISDSETEQVSGLQILSNALTGAVTGQGLNLIESRRIGHSSSHKRDDGTWSSPGGDDDDDDCNPETLWRAYSDLTPLDFKAQSTVTDEDYRVPTENGWQQLNFVVDEYTNDLTGSTESDEDESGNELVVVGADSGSFEIVTQSGVSTGVIDPSTLQGTNGVADILRQSSNPQVRGELSEQLTGLFTRVNYEYDEDSDSIVRSDDHPDTDNDGITDEGYVPSNDDSDDDGNDAAVNSVADSHAYDRVLGVWGGRGAGWKELGFRPRVLRAVDATVDTEYQANQISRNDIYNYDRGNDGNPVEYGGEDDVVFMGQDDEADDMEVLEVFMSESQDLENALRTQDDLHDDIDGVSSPPILYVESGSDGQFSEGDVLFMDEDGDGHFDYQADRTTTGTQIQGPQELEMGEEATYTFEGSMEDPIWALGQTGSEDIAGLQSTDGLSATVSANNPGSFSLTISSLTSDAMESIEVTVQEPELREPDDGDIFNDPGFEVRENDDGSANVGVNGPFVAGKMTFECSIDEFNVVKPPENNGAGPSIYINGDPIQLVELRQNGWTANNCGDERPEFASLNALENIATQSTPLTPFWIEKGEIISTEQDSIHFFAQEEGFYNNLYFRSGKESQPTCGKTAGGLRPLNELSTAYEIQFCDFSGIMSFTSGNYRLSVCEYDSEEEMAKVLLSAGQTNSEIQETCKTPAKQPSFPERSLEISEVKQDSEESDTAAVRSGGSRVHIAGNRQMCMYSVPQIQEADYTVSPGGDSAQKIQEAINKAGPGDLIYLEGGTYNMNSKIEINGDGSANERITIAGRPGETPVLDFSGIPSPDSEDPEFDYGAAVEANGRYWTVRNLEVKGSPGFGIRANDGNQNLIFENIDSHHHALTGIALIESSNNVIRHSKFHHNYDEANGGEHADGVGIKQTPKAMNAGEKRASQNRLECVDMYYNSDDGFDGFRSHDNEIFFNRAWKNGMIEEGRMAPDGNGNGFKFGPWLAGGHIVVGNMAWSNERMQEGKHAKATGFDFNGGEDPITLYHNTAWDNELGYHFGTGHTLANNIASNNDAGNMVYLETEFNTFDSGIDNVRFQSTDPEDDNFLAPIRASPAVDGGKELGTVAGLEEVFEGQAPDMGAFEVGLEVPEEKIVGASSSGGNALQAGVTSTSEFEVNVETPNCAASDSNVKIIEENADWQEINSDQYDVFCVKAGDYTGIGPIDISSSGSSNNRKYIVYDGQSDSHPVNQEDTARAWINGLQFQDGASHWTVTGMSVDPGGFGGSLDFPIKTFPDSNNIVLDRIMASAPNQGFVNTYIIDFRGDSSTLQNSVVRNTLADNGGDRYCVSLNGQPEGVNIVSNELYDCSDGVQLAGLADNPVFPDTVIAHNDIYYTENYHTDGNGNLVEDGEWRCGENAIDIKSGGTSSSENVKVIGNRMWNFGESDTNCAASGTGPSTYAIVIHNAGTEGGINRYGVVKDNIIFNVEGGVILNDIQNWDVTNNLIKSHGYLDVNGNTGDAIGFGSNTDGSWRVEGNTVIDGINWFNPGGSGSIENNVLIEAGDGRAGPASASGNAYYDTEGVLEDNPAVNRDSASEAQNREFCVTLRGFTSPREKCFPKAISTESSPHGTEKGFHLQTDQ